MQLHLTAGKELKVIIIVGLELMIVTKLDNRIMYEKRYIILKVTFILSCNSMTSALTIAIGVHASASVALLFFLFEQWDCDIYWWIMATCRLVTICLIL